MALLGSHQQRLLQHGAGASHRAASPRIGPNLTSSQATEKCLNNHKGRSSSSGAGALAKAGPPAHRFTSRSLVGSFEENILNNRLEPISTVEDYVAEVRASSSSRHPNPIRSKVRVSFYSMGESFPYLGRVNIGRRGYKIPERGTLQVTLFNPNGTLVKLFLLHYDLTDMPPNSQTFLRQRTLFLPTNTTNTTATTRTGLDINPVAPADVQSDDGSPKSGCIRSCKPICTVSFGGHPNSDNALTIDTSDEGGSASKAFLSDKPTAKNSLVQSRLQVTNTGNLRCSRIKYLIQLNIISSKSGRIYLNKDLKIFVSKKVDLETASEIQKQDYELRSFDEMPRNPKYFSRLGSD